MLRQPAVIAAGPSRPFLVWRVVVGVVLFRARLRGRRVLGWRRDGLGPRGAGAIPARSRSRISDRGYAGSAVRAVRWC